MSDRSGSPSEEDEGEQIRPYGDDHDSSEESAEDDEEELKRVAEDFIVDEEEEEDGSEADEDPEERRRRRKEERKRRRREKKARAKREQAELSEDELELLNENRGIGGSKRPSKRARRQSGSDGDDDLDLGGDARLQDMFADDEDRLDDDDDDLGDFIEEDEEPVAGETEEERRERRREEKLKRREEAKKRPEMSGVDRAQWDELHEVFGDGSDYQAALDEEAYMDEDIEAKPKVELEDVFDPSEIKARRLQQEDQVVQAADRPERHQFVNSSLSDNPIPSSDLPFPDTAQAAKYAINKVGMRTGYLFCGQDPSEREIVLGRHNYPRRPELAPQYAKAVEDAMDCLFNKHYEVPYLWHYKQDQFAHLEDNGRRAVHFLDRDDLWSVYSLGVQYQAIHARVQEARSLYVKIKAKRLPSDEERYAAKDAYFENDLLNTICLQSIEAAADAIAWLEYNYATEVRQVREDEAMLADTEGKRRLPERNSTKDIRAGAIMGLVAAFGIDVEAVAAKFTTESTTAPKALVDPTSAPSDLAEEYAGLDTPFSDADQALAAAVKILTTDFTKDPGIRAQARDFAKSYAAVTVTPTDRGMTVIDQYHSYYTFKFLTDKPIGDFTDTPQWLHILKAEEEGLITINIRANAASTQAFTDALIACCRSADYGEIASAWNALRKQVVLDAAEKNLIPMATRWIKEELRRQAEDYVAESCRQELEYRITTRPFTPEVDSDGTPTAVLALTNGKGEMRDAVIAVHIDAEGNIRSQTKFDGLRITKEKDTPEYKAQAKDREAFLGIFRRTDGRKRTHAPAVVVVGGMSVRAMQLKNDVADCLREMAIDELGQAEPTMENYPLPEQLQQAQDMYDAALRPFLTPLIMPNDATARMYMDSDEGKAEHPGLPSNGRYALALARYAQSPLNAYAKMGKRVSDVTFVEHHQRLIAQEKLLLHLERALVNGVCESGVDFWQCIQEPYSRSMLPFVAGLGPRKADSLVKATQKNLDLIVNRHTLRELDILPITTWENAIGFLVMSWELSQMQLTEEAPQEQSEPLDSTRIHPEHYQMAQKMCQDTLEMDAEDREGMHKSDVALRLMIDPDRERKLAELNLDEFAWKLYENGNDNQRHTLGEMVRELIDPRAERRRPFHVPSAWEVMTMLTGETERTIGQGILVTATVRRVFAHRAFCVLESGIDAVLEREFVKDEVIESCEPFVQARTSVKAVIIEVFPARLSARISTRPMDVKQGHPYVQPFAYDRYNDPQRAMQAEQAAAAKKRRQAGKVKRIINHPYWHEMNSGQAEQFLASQPRGEVVVRPSSKGLNHLAVTFKLDEDVIAHADVEEIEKENEYTLGKKLVVQKKYIYGDLDDLYVNYVQSVMNMLEKAERHEKFKPEAEIESYLKNTLLAFPNRSMYAFALDSAHPGYLKLCFLNKSTKDGGHIQTWPVRILPGAYQLGPAEVPGMLELCNAFKAQYSSRLQDQGAGGKTPGIRAGRTPAVGSRTPAVGGRTPAPGMMGGRTPMPPQLGGQTPYGQANPSGRTPMRQGMTPNPYGQSRDPRLGGATPAQGGYSYQQPPPPGGAPGYGMPMLPPGGPAGPPRVVPGGMNPERAAMLARQGGNGY